MAYLSPAEELRTMSEREKLLALKTYIEDKRANEEQAITTRAQGVAVDMNDALQAHLATFEPKRRRFAVLESKVLNPNRTFKKGVGKKMIAEYVNLQAELVNAAELPYKARKDIALKLKAAGYTIWGKDSEGNIAASSPDGAFMIGLYDRISWVGKAKCGYKNSGFAQEYIESLKPI